MTFLHKPLRARARGRARWGARTNSCTWSAAWVASRMTVMVPAGHSAAVSSATASSAIRPAFPGRSNASMASHPAQIWWRPKLFGKLRVWTSSSLVAVASRPPPDSMIVWSSTAPSLLAKWRTSRTNSSEHSRTRTWGTFDMARSVRKSRSDLVVERDPKRVADERRPVLADQRRRGRQPHRDAVDARGRLGDTNRLAGCRLDARAAEIIDTGESPGAVRRSRGYRCPHPRTAPPPRRRRS